MKTELIADYNKYYNIILKLTDTYSEKHNLYNLLMFCIKSIKKNNKETLKEGLKNIFKDFETDVDNLIFVMEYQKLKKCSSFNVYCELLLYFRSFKENRIDVNLNFI